MKAKNMNLQKLPKAFERLLIRINAALMAFANYLQRKSNKMSCGTKKVFLFFFCCSVIFECSLVVVRSFHQRNSFIFPELTVKTIRGVRNFKPDKIISEFEKIQKLKFYVDTLSGPKKDSLLMSHRPHLLDTLIYLENIYLK